MENHIITPRPQRLLDRLLAFADTLRSAGVAAAAVESFAPVPAQDLRRLGIDPAAFAAIHRF